MKKSTKISVRNRNNIRNHQSVRNRQNRQKSNPEETIAYKIYKKGYEMGQIVLDEGLEFDPEITFRKFVAHLLSKKEYSNLISYGDFLEGQRDALEDSGIDRFDFKIRTSPIITDLNEILLELRAKTSMSYIKITNWYDKVTNYYDTNYLDFLLQILQKIKFIARAGDDYLITPIGSEYLKKRSPKTFILFLDNFEPVYPLRKETSDFIKNPKTNQRKILNVKII